VEQVVAATTRGNKSSRRRSMQHMPRDRLSQTCRKPGKHKEFRPLETGRRGDAARDVPTDQQSELVANPGKHKQ